MSLHVYMNNPTAGNTDGQQVSEGDGSNPITVGPLNSSNGEESAPVKLALRCDSNEITNGAIVITPTGTTANLWSLSLDGASWVDYGGAVTIDDIIDDTNYIFYAKAKATIGEAATNDTTVVLEITPDA